MRRKSSEMVKSCLFLLAFCLAVVPVHAEGPEQLVATYSIVAGDPENGDLGVGVQSKFFNAAAIVPWLKAGVGAVATQAFANYSYGPEGLKLLESGLSAEEVVRRLTEIDPDRERRQLAVIDARGNVANFTGSRCLTWAGAIKGKNYSVQGNILVGAAVVQAMAQAFEDTPGDLGDRIMAALDAGQRAGGDSRGKQSGGIVVVRQAAGFAGTSDRLIDIRVDDHPEPLKELRRLLERQKMVNHLFNGFEHYARGDLEQAAEQVRRALEMSPRYAEAHYRMGIIQLQKGRRAEALAELQEAFRLAPEMKRFARKDPALEKVRGEPEFAALLN